MFSSTLRRLHLKFANKETNFSSIRSSKKNYGTENYSHNCSNNQSLSKNNSSKPLPLSTVMLSGACLYYIFYERPNMERKHEELKQETDATQKNLKVMERKHEELKQETNAIQKNLKEMELAYQECKQTGSSRKMELGRDFYNNTFSFDLERSEFEGIVKILDKEKKYGGRRISGWKMTWQTYLDDNLMCDIDDTGNHLSSSAIISHDATVWAKSASFPELSPWQISEIMTVFKRPDSAPPLIFLGGTLYKIIQIEPGAVIRLKKGSRDVIVKKTGRALVFGIYDEPVTQEQCNSLVKKTGDHLVKNGL